MIADIARSARYVRELRRTPLEQRAVLALRWWNFPRCWIRGHQFGSGASIEILEHRTECCSRCGEEIIGRTSRTQLEPAPIDGEDLPWFDCGDNDRGEPVWMGIDWASEDGDRDATD